MSSVGQFEHLSITDLNAIPDDPIVGLNSNTMAMTNVVTGESDPNANLLLAAIERQEHIEKGLIESNI